MLLWMLGAFFLKVLGVEHKHLRRFLELWWGIMYG